MEIRKVAKIVEALTNLVELEFGVNKEDAVSLVANASNYDVSCSKDVLEVIEENFGHKSLMRDKK